MLVQINTPGSRQRVLRNYKKKETNVNAMFVQVVRHDNRFACRVVSCRAHYLSHALLIAIKAARIFAPLSRHEPPMNRDVIGNRYGMDTKPRFPKGTRSTRSNGKERRAYKSEHTYKVHISYIHIR